MNSSTHVGALRPGVDPFQERKPTIRLLVPVLGGKFEFSASDKRLLDLVRHAYKALPVHKLSTQIVRSKIALRLATDSPHSSRWSGRAPPVLSLHSGAGMLSGTVDANNFVTILPQQRAALVTLSELMLEHPYHARYELLEFAVYLLAARTQGFLPLHAACVGARGRGVLFIGESGAGKSTLALHCLRAGMEFLAEDSVLVRPDNLLATGVGTFLHLRVGGRHFLPATPQWIKDAPVIRRRSGIRKYEVDMRTTRFKLARTALRITAIVFLSSQSTPAVRGREGRNLRDGLLHKLAHAAAVRRIHETQPYAVTQPGWTRFSASIARLPCHILYRGKHPSEQVAAIASLLR
jgi:hypothetical protein